MQRLVNAFGETRAAVLIAWLLQWGRLGHPALGGADDPSVVRDWQAFQEQSAGRDWTAGLESVGSDLPVTALSLERFLRELFVLLDAWQR